MENERTLVIFRKFNDDKSIIALFPLDSEKNGLCSSYMAIGQHSQADYYGLLSITKLATPEEYKELKAELERIGYKLDVREKFIRRRK